VTESRYFRYPNLCGDLLTFVADDDVWLAPSAGGRAWRISADRVPAAGPKFSGDGSLVAWTSWRDGPPEIYLASTAGGDAARVSYWSNPGTRLRGWDPAGDILAMTAANQPFQHYTLAYAIPVSDGAGRFAEHRRLPYGPVGDIAIDAASIALLTASYQDPAFWKRYRGGTPVAVGRRPARARITASFRRVVADLSSQFYNPMLVRQAWRSQRLRGRRQHLLMRARRQRPAPPHRPQRHVRPQRQHRRHQDRVPERRRDLDSRRPQPSQRAGQARCHPGRTGFRPCHEADLGRRSPRRPQL
jgi:tricorn protease